MVGLVVMAIIFVVNTIGTAFDIQQIRHEIAYWGLSWFELLSFIFMVAFIIVVSRLISRLNKYEKAKPEFYIELISFPQSGIRIKMDTPQEIFAPQKGYAKIAIRNGRGICHDCIGRIVSISYVINNEAHQIAFTPAELKWDNGQTVINIPNDGVPYYLNLAYIDQSIPKKWQLAISGDEQQREYGIGWWKIDVVLSSQSQIMEPIRLKLALGLANRERPPSGLNLQLWEVVYKAIKKKSQ